MQEWAIVVIVGGIAGLILTLFLGGSDTPLPKLWAFVEETKFHIPYRLAQNVVLGGVGSFVAWAAHSSASFDTHGTNVLQVLGSLGAGGAGGVIVNSLFRQAQDKEQIKRLTDLLKDRLPGGSSGGG